MADITLSSQQQAVTDWALHGQGSLNLVARAGCGKTFTLLQLVLAIAKAQPKAEIFLGAYNKAIAGEIQNKLKEGFLEAGLVFDWKKYQASTMHSAGFSAWRFAAKGVRVDEHKVRTIIDNLIQGTNDWQIQQQLTSTQATIQQCVSYAKQRGFGILEQVEDRKAWYDMVEHFGVNDLPEETPIDWVIEQSISVYQRSLQQDYTVIDFDDMILAPLVHKAKIWPKDWVMIDEAQDTNPARRALALAMVRGNTGRLIAVGDPRQAIYGFTGADADSMDLIKAELNSSTLPLNQTYRCPKAIVKLAQEWVPDIEALPDAPDGVVRSISDSHFLAEKPGNGDAVLCRLNAPLVEMAYNLIRDGIACKVEGREIGTGLVKLARRWKIKTTDALLNRLDKYLDREAAKWKAKGKEERIQPIEDKVATLKVIISKVNEDGEATIDAVEEFIRKLFDDNVTGVLTLASIHKSKGREWKRVFWLDRANTCPSPWAKKDWQIQQEENLQYVAATRALEELIDIIVGGSK